MKFEHKIEYFFFISFVQLFRLIGLKATRIFAKALGLIVFYIIPVRKKVVIENLSIAFPEKSISEIKKLARKTYQNILITFSEMMYLPFLSESKIKKSISFENLEIVKINIGENKPAIFLTGHFGGWEFCLSSLSLFIGRKFLLLAQPQSNSRISDFVMNARKTFGNDVILSGVSVRKLYENLTKGGIVGIAGDQRGTYEGPRFSFFNRDTALYTGTATMALKTSCPIIMTAFERLKNNNYKIYFQEVNFHNLPQDNEDKIRVITQQYITFLEKHISKNPEQYFWLHKIWKY